MNTEADHQKPLVTVVIPLYNKEAYIARSAESVLVQTESRFELIVVDDGSSDKGPDWVRSCSDPRVRLISIENSGVSVARNVGAGEAKADWIAFLDADDAYEPEFLETMLALARRCPEAALVASAYGEITTDEQMTSQDWKFLPTDSQGDYIKDFFAASMHTSPVCSSAVMIRKSVFDEVGGFPPHLRLGEDLDLWFRIASRYKIAWSPRSLSRYYRDASTATQNVLYVGEFGPMEAYRRYLASGVRSPLHFSIERYIAQSQMLHYFLGNYYCGRRDLARQALAAAKKAGVAKRAWLKGTFLMLIPSKLALAMSKRNLKFASVSRPVRDSSP